MGPNPGPAAGAAVILIGIIAIMIWKGAKHRALHWLALAAGLCGSYIVLGYLGTLASYSVYGVGVTVLVVIFGGLIFWYEVVKNRKPHKVRTPAIAFALGVALMAGSSGIQHIAQHATNTVTTVVDHTTSGVSGR